MMTEPGRSSGVQELIEKLREEGVTQGENRAREILDEARRQAAAILEEAHREAKAIRRQAEVEADRMRKAGEDAVRLAIRDAVLALKAEITEKFAGRVRQLVEHGMKDEKFLQRLIFEIVRRAAPDAGEGPIEVLLPEEAVGLEELRRKPEEVKEGTLSHFVLSIASEVLRDGVTFGQAEDESAGVRIQLLEDEVQIDLTDRAISDLLLKHLLPRFRALMEGVVQ